MICISGVPGTGKSTVGALLSEMGLMVCDAASVAEEAGCISGEEVDIQCLQQRGNFTGCDVLQSHFSHLVLCDKVVILETDPDMLSRRLEERGYSDQKVRENIDAQLSGTIYYESLDRLPAGRISRIDTTSDPPQSTARKIALLVESDEKT